MTRNNFILNIAKIAGASVVSQIVIFATTPIFTRLYDPGDVGIASVFLAIVFSIAPATSFSYHHAIVMAEDDAEATRIAVLSFLLTLIVSILLFIPFGMFHRLIFSSLIPQDLWKYLWLIPLSVFIKGVGSILLMENSREGNFGLLGRSRIVQTVSERALVLCPAFFGKAEASVIIVGRLISYFLEIVPFRRVFQKLKARIRSLTFKSLKDTAVKYRSFPLYANWTYLLTNLSAYVAVFIMAVFLTPEFIGLYVISERVLFTPLMVFGDSLKSVYYQKAATQKDDPDLLRSFYLRIRQRLIAYSIFPMLIMLFFGREIFGLFLGVKWEAAGGIAGVMCILAFFQFISSPVMSVVNVLDRQKIYLVFAWVLLSLKFLSFAVGGLMGQPMTAVWLSVITGSIANIAALGWIDWLLSIDLKQMPLQVMSYSLLSLILLFGVRFILNILPGTLCLILTLGVASLIYYVLVIRHVEGVSVVHLLKNVKAMSAKQTS